MLQYDDAQRLSQELSRVADRSAVCPPITVPARLHLDRATVENEWVRSRHRTPSILPLQATDVRVLRALPMNNSANQWPAALELAAELDAAPDVIRSTLSRLHSRSLIEHDGGRPRRWARLPRAEQVLELTD
jgi:hypothetical protein